MLRKVSLLLVLVLFAVTVSPVLAQDSATDASIYLPMVTSGGEAITQQAAQEVDLTDTMDAVTAASRGGTGAVFVSTNAVDDVRGNEVVMYERAADGTLTLVGYFPTGGQGSGPGTRFRADGLGSANAVVPEQE